MRIAVLWQSMSGYFSASLRALHNLPGIEVCLAYRSAHPDAPFDSASFNWISPQYSWDREPSVPRLDSLLADFKPDVVLISSWHINGYRSALRRLRNRPTRVLCMDNQWLGTPKQWLGRLTWRLYIRPLFDVAFVPGDRQVAFANRLGFRNSRILRGLYCADNEAFKRPSDGLPAPDRAFLYVGRLTDSKGIPVLMDGYRRYRDLDPEPWPLRVAGAGPLLELVTATTGVDYLGFVQPKDLPRTMWAASSLVLPSRFEPWGVVVHEAVIAGLVPICSEPVGAAVHLVQDGYNGYIVPDNNAIELAAAMYRVARKSAPELEAMSKASRLMSTQFTSERWARYLVETLSARPTLVRNLTL